MTTPSMFERVLVVVLGAGLLANAVASVELHHRTRQTFTAHEREADLMRRLSDDRSELLMKVHRASLPGNIAAGAAELGLKGATGANTVTMVQEEDGRIVWSEETLARLAAWNAEQAEKEKKAAVKAAERAKRQGAPR